MYLFKSFALIRTIRRCKIKIHDSASKQGTNGTALTVPHKLVKAPETRDLPGGGAVIDDK